MGVQVSHRPVFWSQRRIARGEHLEQHPRGGGGGGSVPAVARRAAGFRAQQAHLARQGICQHGTLFPAM